MHKPIIAFCLVLTVTELLTGITHYARAATTASSACPEDWQEFDGYCYRASQFELELQFSWHNARQNCMSQGGDLVSIHSETEQAIVYSLLTGIAEQFWIGLNGLDGELVWSDGTDVDFVNWADGQPDSENELKLCVHMDSFQSASSWKTQNCGLDFLTGSVCKKAIGSDVPMTTTPPPVLDSYCPEGFFELPVFDSSLTGTRNKCYKMVFSEGDVDEGSDWYEARENCRNQPGYKPDLISIITAEEQAALTSQLDTKSWGLWIGYYYANPIWFWSDQSSAVFENWVAPPFNADGYCIVMLPNADTAGKWDSIDCTDKRGYICQTFKDPSDPIETPPTTPSNSCTGDWIPYMDNCYLVSTDTATWSDAQDACQAQGGNLASIYSAAENGAVDYLTRNLDAIWLGMSRSDSSSAFQWSDGSVILYTNFIDGGDTPPGDNNCIIFNNANTWQDSDCDNDYPYICKQSYGPVPTTPVYTGSEPCPSSEWVEFGSACYLFVITTLGFEAAETTCQSDNSHLASVHSYMENVFLRDLAISKGAFHVYFGLYKETGTDLDSFMYTDGTPVDYISWAPGEPNNPGFEDCVQLYTFDKDEQFTLLWNNIPCGEQYQFICKYDREAPPSSGLNNTIPPHYLVHNATFSTETGEDFTTECTLAYSIQINQKAQALRAEVNGLIGQELCATDGVTAQQLNVIYVTCPFATSGSQGETNPSYIIQLSADLSLSSVHACVSDVSAYLALYSSWGDSVLDPEPGCPNVRFDGSSFNEEFNRYLCLGSTSLPSAEGYDLEEAFLNYGVYHVGEFSSEDSSDITTDCILRYSNAFTLTAFTVAQQANTAIENGQLCDQLDISIANISPLFLTGNGNQGSTLKRYIINPSLGMTFQDISSCAQELSTYLSDQSNWPDPIIEPITGCPNLIFNDAFEETDQEWICSNSQNLKEPKSAASLHSQEKEDPMEKHQIQVDNTDKGHTMHAKENPKISMMQENFKKILLGKN